MKKEVNLPSTKPEKLNLSKRTISNLDPSQMRTILGAGHSGHGHTGGGQTKNGNTCPGHNTCNGC